MKALLVAILLILVSNAADISVCKEYKDDTVRLNCYDNIEINKVDEVKPVKGVKPFIDLSYYRHPRVNGLNTVRLFLGYKNNTKKTIVGVISTVKISNVFGEMLLSQTFKDEVKVSSGKRYKPSTFWEWNVHTKFHKDVFKAVQTKTYKAEVLITKVIFSDGTFLEN